MAANTDAILTLAELKEAMDLPAGHISEDAKLTRYLSMAIDRVANDTSRALIDEPATVFASIPVDGEEPMVIDEPDFIFDTKNTEHDIDYWTDKGDGLDADPDGSISRNDIGRIVYADGCALLYAADGWPDDVLEGTRARIKGTRSTYGSAFPDGLRYAIIVLVRYYYSGAEKVPQAYFTNIHSYRDLA